MDRSGIIGRSHISFAMTSDGCHLTTFGLALSIAPRLELRAESESHQFESSLARSYRRPKTLGREHRYLTGPSLTVVAIGSEFAFWSREVVKVRTSKRRKLHVRHVSVSTSCSSCQFGWRPRPTDHGGDDITQKSTQVRSLEQTRTLPTVGTWDA